MPKKGKGFHVVVFMMANYLLQRAQMRNDGGLVKAVVVHKRKILKKELGNIEHVYIITLRK